MKIRHLLAQIVAGSIAIGSLLATLTAEASETVIEVPQGSGAFPTVGQVNCLEELGSGRLCAATYECADDEGELWGDMANHDGRRVLSADSPVARRRSCSISVDGRASVRWFTGFSPDGRDGELVGLTPKHDATPPVIRRAPTGGSGGNGSFLAWFVERHGIDDLAGEVLNHACGHLVEGTPHREECEYHPYRPMLGLALSAAAYESTRFTRCVAEFLFSFHERKRAEFPNTTQPSSPLVIIANESSADPTLQSYGQDFHSMLKTFSYDEPPQWRAEVRYFNDSDVRRWHECRTMLAEQLDAEGLARLNTGD